MSLNPYLNFDGSCRDAFEHYREVFGGDFDVLQTFGDGPDGMPVADADKDKVMHVSLGVGTSVLMGSDVPSAGDFAAPFAAGNNVQISYSPESREECEERFNKLAEGGTVLMPLQDQFWGSYFGSCVDRFGITWMFNYDNPSS